jgi:hypothetical protein
MFPLRPHDLFLRILTQAWLRIAWAPASPQRREHCRHNAQNYTLWGIVFSRIIDYSDSQEESLVESGPRRLWAARASHGLGNEAALCEDSGGLTSFAASLR